jgi:menaquinone-dependent protoporphyrinogen oxidase
MQTLILYSTTDGHTLRICRFLQRLLAAGQDAEAVLLPIENAADIRLGDYGGVIIGASIRYGKHSPLVTEFVNSHAALLETLPNAFFSVNLVARKAGKNSPEGNPYVKKFLRQIAWKPRRVAVFAGKLDYPRYSFLDRQIIRLIMWMTGGPTDSNAVVEYTDWQQVEEFGRSFSEGSSAAASLQ